MLDLTELLRIPRIDAGFDIFPDRTHVAFACNKTGSWEIYELNLSPQNGEESEAKLITRGQGAKFSPRYSPDGKYLAYALDADGSESYHIVLYNLQSNSCIDLTPDSTYARQPNFAFSPDGNTLAILSDEQGQFALYLLSIETGEKKLLLDIQRPIWDVKWSPDGKWIAAEAEMEASDRGIFVVQVSGGTWKQIKSNTASLNAQHPAWSPDSRFIAFSAESGEWFDIGLFDVETDKLEWLTGSIGDDTSPCWSLDGERIGWIHTEGAVNSIMLHERAVGDKRYQVSAGIHHQPQFTRNDEIIFLFESPRQPPDLWKLDLDGAFRQLTNSLPDKLRNMEFVFPEEIAYPSDHANVPALLYRGKSDSAVINIHGGPNWHTQYLWDPISAHMASRGWTVLTPNYRGSTGYGRTWQIASRFDMGGIDTRDCAAGVDYLLHERIARKFAVTGRSHGGYLTMTCLTQFPELWCGGSAVVPFMNWFKSHEDSREDLQHWNIENMGDPKENYERWYNASPYFFLDRLNAPVQLICGGNDPRCPASDSLNARDKLVGLGKDVEFILYEAEGHRGERMERLKFLSDEDIQAMHEATLQVLNEVGVIWTHQPSLAILMDAGCRMNGNRVCFPSDLVMDSVAKANKRPCVRGRNGQVNELGGGNLYFHNLGGARDVFDAKTGTRHAATNEDACNAIRLLDALPNCNTVTPFFTPPDVSNELMSMYMFRHALSNTTKPVQGPGIQFGHEVKYAVEMAAVVGTPASELTLSLSPVSPLTMHDIAAEAIMEMAKAGVILANLPCPTGGATSPMTITGSIVQQSAESLAPLVLAQIINPGCGVVYCGRLGMLEPRTGLIWSGVELGLSSAATVQLGHYYGFAVNVYGFSTNAHTLDAQNAFERGLNATIPALAGADELSGIGEMEAGVMGSFAQMVLDNELAGSVLRLRNGLSADAEHLAVDIIGNVMNGTRNFLGQKHTMKHLRAGEIALTKLAERNSWDTWDEKLERKQMADHAIEETERILREHIVPPLEPEQHKELDRIMVAAEKEFEKKK